jgi:drug/metabolite transporter (DMT)-like permease
VTAWVFVRPVGLPTALALTTALIAVSSSAPITAYALAPALAIAFWRNTLAVGVIGPVALVRARSQLKDLTHDRRTLVVCVLAGLALAAHFGAWLPSTKLTNVTTATALVSTTPIWSAFITTAQGNRLMRSTWIGIAIAVVGAILTTGADVRVSGRAALGDALALIGGAAAAVYTAFGERARATLTTTVYTLVCYSVCAVTLGVVCVVSGTRLAGFPATAWAAIAGITVGAQLLGHTLINFSLERVPATTVTVLMLLEVPGACLIGWLWLGQVPPLASVPGLVVLVSGVFVVLVGARGQGRGGTRISPDAIATT